MSTFQTCWTSKEAFFYTNLNMNWYHKRLEVKDGWTEQEFAKWCDGNHLVDCQEIWMNAVLFVMLCSHCWNICMHHTRKTAGIWCFALGNQEYAGDIKADYNDGLRVGLQAYCQAPSCQP
jgi:hypothetical protein